MTSSRRIYLDNAATSWPKPPVVYDAVDDYLRNNGASLGRSVYSEATEIQQLVASARSDLATLLSVTEPRRIIFTTGGTESLNLAIHGLLRAGDHVVTTVVEHNSVLRPLRFLADTIGIQVSYLPCDADGVVAPDDVRKAIQPNTKLIAVIHASNVTGVLQPIDAICAVAKEREIPLLVDAAQSIGHVPIDLSLLPADLIAAPTHKGLLGPLGGGMLYIGDDLDKTLRPLVQGGTGTASDDDRQPESLPDKFESGNHNVPGLVGLAASLRYLCELGIADIQAKETAMTAALLNGLHSIDGVTVYGSMNAAGRVGVVSFNVVGVDPQDVAAMLDASYQIQVRSGLHCAPRIHELLGTKELGGTVRMSIGPFTTDDDIDRAITAISEIAASL